MAEIFVGAVRARKAGKVMAPDNAGVAASFGNTCDVNQVARLEDVGRDDTPVRA